MILVWVIVFLCVLSVMLIFCACFVAGASAQWEEYKECSNIMNPDNLNSQGSGNGSKTGKNTGRNTLSVYSWL